MENNSPISETMLITLWAKATETERKNPLLQDEKSVEIIRQLDYDFSRFRKAKMSQVGVCIRAKLIDEETKSFIDTHPDGVVIQLGAGLDARYNRIGKPNIVHWYDLDLPDVIDLRKRFFDETEKNSFLSLSLFDYQWIEKVIDHQKPTLIIIEGVLMYFCQEEIKAFFETLCNRFEKVSVIFDMLYYKGVGKAKNNDSVKSTSGKPEFKWSLYHTADMEQWNEKIHIDKELFMSDYDQGRYPFVLRWLCKIPSFYRNYNQRIVKLQIENK